MFIITSEGAFPLPCPFKPGKLFGIVHLHAGGTIPRRERRCIDRYDSGYVLVEADPMSPAAPGLRPNDFDLKTLRWALWSATLVVPWGGLIPFDQDQFTQRLEAHTKKGKRIALLLIRDEHHDEWTRFAADHAREEAEFRHCQSKFVYFAKTSQPDFAAIDFPAFFRVDLSGSMAALSI